MSAGLDITVHGDAYAIVPGATYVIEIDRNGVTLEQLLAYQEKFQQATGAKCVLMGPGMHIVPANAEVTP